MTAATRAAPDTIAHAVARLQRQRLASDIGIVIAGHLALLVPIVVLLWTPAVRARVISWIAAVLFATAARALWQWRARDPAMPDHVVIVGTRFLVLLHGLAWGVSLALLVHVITEQERAIVLIGFAGLVASASTTLVGDRASMLCLLAGTYAPVLLSLALAPLERDDVVVAVMIVLFSGVVLSLHRRGQRALIQQLTTARSLQESEERFRSFFERSPVGILITTPASKVVRANPAVTAILGYSREELLHISWEDITHPEDLAASQEAVRRLSSGEVERYEFEKRCRAKDGRWVWARNTIGVHRDPDGKILHFLAHIQDITASKRAAQAVAESERYFRTLTEQSSDIVVLLDVETRVLYASPSMEHILGYAPEELLGQRAFVLVHADDLESVMATVMEGIAIPGAIRRMEYRFRHKDGSWRFLEGVGRNLLDDPTIAAIVVNARDATERKEVEATLRERERQLADLVRELQAALAEVKTLQGILPICASCKRIHSEDDRWEAVESYVREHTNAEFTHGLCPDCAARDWGTTAARRDGGS